MYELQFKQYTQSLLYEDWSWETNYFFVWLCSKNFFSLKFNYISKLTIYQYKNSVQTLENSLAACS